MSVLSTNFYQFIRPNSTMVAWTNAQRTTFFTNAAHMGLSDETRAALVVKGIDEPDDLVDFDSSTFSTAADNLCRPSGRVPHPDPAQAATGATIQTPPTLLERNFRSGLA